MMRIPSLCALVVVAAVPLCHADPAPGPAARAGVVDATPIVGSVDDPASERGHCTIELGGRLLDPGTAAIVVPEAATPQEQYAAEDLQRHLRLITGRDFAIVGEKGAPDGIFVGRTRRAAKVGVHFDALGLEGVHLKTVGHSLVLAGNQRGVLYAVYTFLEDCLGCRWFTADCATWPRAGTLVVDRVDRRYVPPLEFRAGDYPCARPGAFAVRLRLNGNNHQMSVEQGGRKGVHSLAHTFAALCPPQQYFETHPEYFALVGGQRQSGYAQLCLTNPDVLRICIAGVRRWISENPDMKVFSVSQNDVDNHCECANCQRVADEEGSQAGPVLRFCNAIADDIRDDYPDVAIETLAYQYTRKPPQLTRPRPNVIVCLCSIECCFVHGLADDAFNRSFTDDIRGWKRICNRLWIWDYVINYGHSICPFPNLQVLQPNIRFFIDNGVKGIYEESCYYTPGSELAELRNYIIAKTLWDPSYDTGRAIHEFCAAYYGPAAPQVEAYLTLIHTEVPQMPGVHMQIGTHPRQYLSDALLDRSSALFDQAEAAVAQDPVRLQRVQVARLPVLYAQIVFATSGAYVEQAGKLVQQEARDAAGQIDRFSRIAHAAQVTHVREGGGPGQLDDWLAAVPRQPGQLQVVTLQNGQLRADLLPALGGRLWRLTWLPGHRQLLRVAGTDAALIPAEGGYEEYSQGDYRSAGWSESYTVVAQSERSATLEVRLRNGLRLTRTYELAADSARLRVSSVLTNDSDQPVAACLRGHPEFALGNPAAASVRLLTSAGTTDTVSLVDPADPQAERELWLRGAALPAGQWELVDGDAGIVLVHRFQPGEVAQALLNRSGRLARVNLELYGPSITLAPGEHTQLTQSFEVRPR